MEFIITFEPAFEYLSNAIKLIEMVLPYLLQWKHSRFFYFCCIYLDWIWITYNCQKNIFYITFVTGYVIIPFDSA